MPKKRPRARRGDHPRGDPRAGNVGRPGRVLAGRLPALQRHAGEGGSRVEGVHGRRQGLGEDDFNFNFSIGICY